MSDGPAETKALPRKPTRPYGIFRDGHLIAAARNNVEAYRISGIYLHHFPHRTYEVLLRCENHPLESMVDCMVCDRIHADADQGSNTEQWVKE